jgi:hypothetical protein
MANVTIGHIIDNLVQVTLGDVSAVTWSEETLLDWANQGERKIVSLVPQANPVIESVALSSAAKQSIPSGGIAFINVIRNMGTTPGTTPGRAVTLTTIAALAAFAPDWNTDTQTTAIYNAMPDPLDPTTFYVYAPSDGTGYVELEYADTPTVIDYDAGEAWKASYPTIKEGYVDPLVSYILWRAFSQDSGIQGTRQRAIDARGAFYQGLGLQVPQGGR